jgi:hypothetical protein
MANDDQPRTFADSAGIGQIVSAHGGDDGEGPLIERLWPGRVVVRQGAAWAWVVISSDSLTSCGPASWFAPSLARRQPSREIASEAHGACKPSKGSQVPAVRSPVIHGNQGPSIGPFGGAGRSLGTLRGWVLGRGWSAGWRARSGDEMRSNRARWS